jgi:hypothetical protein
MQDFDYYNASYGNCGLVVNLTVGSGFQYGYASGGYGYMVYNGSAYNWTGTNWSANSMGYGYRVNSSYVGYDLASSFSYVVNWIVPAGWSGTYTAYVIINTTTSNQAISRFFAAGRSFSVSTTTTTTTTETTTASSDDETTTTVKNNNGEVCNSNDECLSGHCVHGRCRVSETHCGDGYCDAGEQCIDDDSACPLGQICTNGCQKVNVTRAEYELGASKESLMEILSRDVKLLNVLVTIMKMTNETKVKLAENGEKISKYLGVKRTVTNKTMLLEITYNKSVKIKNLMIYDNITKKFAENAGNMSIRSGGEVHIVEQDPMILTVFDMVYPGVLKIEYETKNSTATIRDFTEPVIFGGEVIEIVCGDGVCDKNEDCPEDCDSWLVIVGIIVLVVVVLFIYRRKLLQIYRTLTKLRLPKPALLASESETTNKKKIKRDRREFKYRYKAK